MLNEVANWANDAAAVEKSLRLLQALVQIVAGLSLTQQDAAPWSKARGQFALARRYLRLFKWIDCGQVTIREWSTNKPLLRRSFATAKWGLLALYFFTEMFCITNAMGLTASPFLTALQHHALQCWYFAIVASIFLTSYDIVNSEQQSQQHYIQYLVDFCDILIPGSAVGWISVDTVTVGVTSSISSTITGWQIWKRVQSEAKEKAMRQEKRKVVSNGNAMSEKMELKESGEKSIQRKSNGVVAGAEAKKST